MMNKWIVFLTVLFGFSVSAMAYIDPGSGSAIMSAIIGGAMAIGMAVKTYWYKVKSFFKKSKATRESGKK